MAKKGLEWREVIKVVRGLVNLALDGVELSKAYREERQERARAERVNAITLVALEAEEAEARARIREAEPKIPKPAQRKSKPHR